MGEQLVPGQRIRLREGLDRYGGMFGRIIHREWVTGSTIYPRERPVAGSGQGRLGLVVELEQPALGLEPVILCYEDQVALAIPE